MSGTVSPTAGFAVGGQGITLSPAQLQQWQNYFQSPGSNYSAGALQPSNALVQTGATWNPAIPWLTPTTTGQGMNLPLSALGIQTGATQTQTAANVANSPYAGNPSNPYYSNILNQIASGTFQPTYAPAPVQQAAPPSNFAQMVGGQLYGNYTPQETQLAQYLGLGNQVNLLPGAVNALTALPNPGDPYAQATALENYMNVANPQVPLSQQILPGEFDYQRGGGG